MAANRKPSILRRLLFVALGTLSLAAGVIGIFVPGVPTTEFVLGASYFFARSSPTLQARLERNRWFGPALQRFRETRGMPRKSKVAALAWMWTGLAISVPALASVGVTAQVLALSMGCLGSIVILFLVRTTAARQPLILS